MHHYSTITANTLALRLDMQHIWRMVLPEMSYNTPFLSHGLLSVAALHKGHLLPAKRDTYLDLAAYHQTRGMHGFRSIFSSVDEKNWHPAFCFSSTIVIYAFLPAGRTQDAMADILQIFVLIRGIRSSLLGAGHNLTETPFSAWSNGIWIVGENDEASYEYVILPSPRTDRLTIVVKLRPAIGTYCPAFGYIPGTASSLRFLPR